MNEIEMTLASFRYSREQTLGLLAKIEAEPDPVAVLGWRPGPGRAHIAWQLLHVAITEEVFSTERLIPGSKARWPELVARYEGGSTPDDDIPAPDKIRELLSSSRAHLEETLSGFTPAQLEEVPPPLAQRGWTLRKTLHVLGWHEAHHQGQAHLTYNLWKTSQSKPRG